MGAKLSDSGADWDQYEQASGSSNLDRPVCKRCRNLITDDNWKRDMLGYVCSVCDARERSEERRA